MSTARGQIANRLRLTDQNHIELECDVANLEMLRKFAAAKLPIRLAVADEFNAAKELAAMGFIKLAIPPMRKGRDTYGQQDPALVLAITPSGKRAIAP